MEENDCFHGQLGQIGEILEEARQDHRVVSEDELGLHLGERVDKLADLEPL